MNPHYFECQCDCISHTIRFDFDEEYNEIYLSTFLTQYQPWYRRFAAAFKYIFGYPCGFDTTMLRNEDIPRLITLLERIT